MIVGTMEKTCLITGSTSGIGKETARSLAKRGYRIILHGRDPEKGEKAAKELRSETGSESIDLLLYDLSDFGEVRKLAEKIRESYQNLNVLINNAGIWLSKRRLNGNGIEMTFVVNHLSHFLLTNLLLDRIAKSDHARIVNVSSEVHQNASIDYEDLTGEEGPSGYEAYKQSKLANVLFTFELADRVEGEGIDVNCFHPGAVRSELGRDHRFLKYLWKWFPFFRGPKEGAETAIYLATSPDVNGVSGKYFVDREESDPSPKAYEENLRQKLWNESVKLTGLESGRYFDFQG